MSLFHFFSNIVDVGFLFTTVLTFYKGESMNTSKTRWSEHALVPRFLKEGNNKVLRIYVSMCLTL